MSKSSALVQGTLDLLILRILALQPAHGWAIAHRLRQMSGDVLKVGQGALYPALHKLEQNGWIASEWAVSENNRRAKYYKLTKAGRKVLEHESAEWERLSAQQAVGPDKFPSTDDLPEVAVRIPNVSSPNRKLGPLADRFRLSRVIQERSGNW